MAVTVPLLSLRPEVDELWDELQAAFGEILRSGQFILGPYVEAFEQAIADYLQVRHAVAVNSGTDALILALDALGLSTGDEVITTPFTFFATGEAVSRLGATPVFVDIDEKTFNINPALIEPALSDRTRAILPVHLYGQPAAMDPIRKVADAHGLPVVEDAAQAIGAEYEGRSVGTLGAAAAFSFYPTKNLGAYGEGGLVATDDDALAESVRLLRAHGEKKRYHNERIGYNSRMDAFQGAVLAIKLKRLDAYNHRRREIARRYDQAFQNIKNLVIPHVADNVTAVYHQYTLRITGGDNGINRDVVQKQLADQGVSSAIFYPKPLHHLPVYAGMQADCPVADKAAQEVLCLPIFPQLSEQQVQTVIEAMMQIVGV